MDKSLPSSLISPLETASKYSIFKRVANLGLLIIAISICVNLWLLSSNNSANWHKKQSNQLGKSLTALSAQLMAKSILEDDSATLTLQLQSIIQDPHVQSASIYDKQGRQLADNQMTNSIIAAYKLTEVPPLVFVYPIEYQNNIIGYLRIMLDRQKVMAFHDSYQTELYQKLITLMLLACAAGALLARVFYKTWYRHKLTSNSAQNSVKN